MPDKTQITKAIPDYDPDIREKRKQIIVKRKTYTERRETRAFANRHLAAAFEQWSRQ